MIVPDPESSQDIWDHEFQGHIVSICDGNMKPVETQDNSTLAIVKDQDGNTYVVEINRLKKAED